MKKKNVLICVSAALAVVGIGAAAWFNRERLEEKIDQLLDKASLLSGEAADDDYWEYLCQL